MVLVKKQNPNQKTPSYTTFPQNSIQFLLGVPLRKNFGSGFRLYLSVTLQGYLPKSRDHPLHKKKTLLNSTRWSKNLKKIVSLNPKKETQ
ncbi:hypothetical protein FPG59_07045 [Flavobacterium sp. FPG59]|nr:hypothetical protein FPG59_07045 [Flavobacterium sp. FPG59]